MKNLTQNLLANNPSSFSSFSSFRAVSQQFQQGSFKTETVSRKVLKKVLRNFHIPIKDIHTFFKSFNHLSIVACFIEVGNPLLLFFGWVASLICFNL